MDLPDIFLSRSGGHSAQGSNCNKINYKNITQENNHELDSH